MSTDEKLRTMRLISDGILDVLQRYPSPDEMRMGMEVMLGLLANLAAKQPNVEEARDGLVKALDALIAQETEGTRN